MRRSIPVRILTVLLVSLLLVVGFSVRAQDEVNLLQNPGFEAPYATLDGNPPRVVAQGWTPWHVPRGSDDFSYENVQPEYAQTSPDSTRIRSGEDAQRMFTSFFTFEGGVFQRVTGITAGTEMRFSVYGRVWSSSLSDPAQSESPGGVIVQVGIDPTGGTDGTSSAIIWSPPTEQYDDYRQYSVIATATGTAVTAFIRASIDIPVADSSIWLDDAVLSATVPTVTATDTSAPPTATNTQEVVIIPTATNTQEVVVIPTATNTQEVVVIPTATNTVEAPVVTATDVILPTDLPTETTAPTATNTQPAPTDDGNATPTREGDAGATNPPAATATATTETVNPTATATTATGTGGPAGDTFPQTLVHQVQRGDTVGRLAVLYGTTIESIIQANDLDENALIYVGQNLLVPVRLAAPATSTPTITPEVAETAVPTADPGAGGAGGETVYVVQPGDTLFRIAARFNTTVGAMAQLNGIVNPSLIRVGQQLIVPGTGGPITSPQPTSPAQTGTPPRAAASYVVQPGDTVYRISLRFGVSMQALVEANGILNANLIYVGQTLLIP